ncbi:hypothetical protein [Sphingomonas hengshuiensis]|uniref:Uncharacterized protein n=1 Tax=Sphingomonas hengshuiensis TaxID=1609977 RepID=A0A7U4J8M0_9SPHN|nr:hypothetical protein [Sphingomonas hengshuiensis]AJP72256.1 hypothetical protein TS85_11340 [Sphingomonas hengshuiensis]
MMGGVIDMARGKAMQIMAGMLGAAVLALTIALLIAKADAQHWHSQFTGEQDRHRLTIAEFKRGTAEAKVADLEHVAAVRARDDAIAKETQHDIQTQLADNLALAARYAERMRRGAPGDGQGGGGHAGVPAAADPAGDPAAGGGFAIVPRSDLDTCTRNTVIARGWQAWWAAVGQGVR